MKKEPIQIKVSKCLIHKKPSFVILALALESMVFCKIAEKTFQPFNVRDENMRSTYVGLAKIFSSLGRDFDRIIKLTGVDLTTKKGKIFLEKYSEIPKDDSQYEIFIKELNRLISKTK